MMMPKSIKTIAVMCLAAGVASSAHAQIEIVSPNGLETVAGANNNAWPLTTTIASQRYQQVHASTEFSALAGPSQLVELRFRPDEAVSGNPWTNVTMLDIRFSTTQAAPDQLSTEFAANVGPDETVVYSGQAEYSTTQVGNTPGGPPLLFDIVITLQTPFLYDPSMGNLLMEIRRDGHTMPGNRPLDAHNVAGDGVSRLFTNSSGTSSSPTGSTTGSHGLVTMFIFQPAGPVCYANCDGSTVEPVLNVDDFTCFINEYAAAQGLPHEQQVAHYANCDGSTVAPALNVDDFTCFINEYAAGCR